MPPISRTALLLVSVLSMLVRLFSPLNLQAMVIYEWTVGSETLESRTTTSLLRYYSVVEVDSLKVRYIRQKSGHSLYRIRAQFPDNSVNTGRILFLSLGQLQVFPTDVIRVALGENLYQELLRSRDEMANYSTRIDLGTSFDHHDWTGNHSITWSIWDRFDISIGEELNGFVALGAPESNLDFWADGTGRLGIASPLLEFAFLFPFSSGSVAIGPLPERLLVPAYGASALLRYNQWTGRIRFSDATEETINSTQSTNRSFVHSLSSALLGEKEFLTEIGNFSLTAGVGLEEFTELKRVNGALEHAGYVHRISPVIRIAYTTADENLRLSTGINDLALRSSITIRFSSTIWFEARAVNTNIFRNHKVFEHPFSLFLTPRIKF